MLNKQKNRLAEARTGSDPARFDVFCFNQYCGPVMDSAGKLATPRMNYMGCEHPFILRFWRRAHVYSCSVCGAEHWFRRDFWGSRWVSMQRSPRRAS